MQRRRLHADEGDTTVVNNSRLAYKGRRREVDRFVSATLIDSTRSANLCPRKNEVIQSSAEQS